LADAKGVDAAAQTPQTAARLDEIIDRMIKREHDEIAAFDPYSPMIETYIQEVKFKQAFGTVPKSDYYFLGQADFRGRLKVRTMTDGGRKDSFLWSFDPGGFLQMIYIDRGEFDKVHYRFKYSGREFWARCGASFLMCPQRPKCAEHGLSCASGWRTRTLL
jgi:hypothetical protein